MHYTKVVLFFLVLVSFFNTVQAQLKVITWQVNISKTSDLKIGEVITVKFVPSFPKGQKYYLHAYKNISIDAGDCQLFVQPPSLYLDKTTAGIEAAELSERPAPSVKKDEMECYEGDKSIMKPIDTYVFYDAPEFTQNFKITALPAKLDGGFKVSICKEGQCTFDTYDFSYKLTGGSGLSASQKDLTPVVKTDSSITKNSFTSPSTELSNTLSNVKPPVSQLKESEPLWLFFLKAFGAGLLALITPCVFPMLPMTVSFFTKRSKNRIVGIKNAIIYALSIIVIYVILGLTITITFGATALYNISVDPWVNLIFFFILFIFALSFLGMFEITLPSSWATKADAASERGGVLGIFFMALTLAIASFSCTGPLAGFILVDAAQGELMQPTIGMLGFSSGIAVPFAFFALFPGLLNSLPKSGGWLNVVKVVLGFVELALSLKFLSQSDLIWDLGLLDREVFIGLWVVISIILGVYLLGKIQLPHDTPVEKLSVPRLILAMCSFSFAAILLPGLWGAPLPALSGLLPPPNDQVGVRLAPYYGSMSSKNTTTEIKSICDIKRKHAEKLASKAPSGYCMFYDLEEGIAYAKQVNKPIFLDFTGITCANCREMELKVWPKPEIKQTLMEKYVMISLYVDLPKALDNPQQAPDGSKLRSVGDVNKFIQQSRYKILAQPYYVIVDHDMNTLVEGIGYTPNVEEYKAFLERGLKAFSLKRIG